VQLEARLEHVQVVVVVFDVEHFGHVADSVPTLITSSLNHLVGAAGRKPRQPVAAGSVLPRWLSRNPWGRPELF
jgi:hypothetical protein